MIALLPLIGLFANVVLQVLGSTSVVSPQTATLIEDLLRGTMPLLSSLSTMKSGETTKVQDVLAVLAGLSAIIATLKSDTNLPADRLEMLNKLDGETSAAIVAYVKAGSGFDANTYTLIPTV